MNRRALVLGSLACVAWSTVFVLGRLTISRHDTDPVVLGLYRFGVGAVVLCVVAVGWRGPSALAAAARRERWRVLLLGLTGGFGMGFFVFLGLQQTNSIPVQLIMNSNPVLIVPLSLVIGERVGLGKVAGVVLGVTGCALVLWGVPPSVVVANPNHLLGGVFAALSGLCWALYTVFGRDVVRRHGALVLTALSMAIGAALFLIVCLATGRDLALGREGALVGLYLGVVPTALGFWAWYVALETLPANVLGPLQFIVPVCGVALAVALLGEPLTFLVVVGGVVALAGVYFSTRERSAGSKA